MGNHLKTPVSLRLDERELKMLNALAKKYGGKQAVIVAGLEALSMKPSEISRELLIEEIKRRLK